MGVPMARRCVLPRMANLASPLGADFVAEVGDYYARGLPRFVDTSSYYAAFGER
jgi:hypothetical protein